MKTGLLIALAVGALALLALLYHLHYRRAGANGAIVHVRNEFEFTAHAPYQVVAPLFGAEGERAWSGGHWDPHFLYPQPAAGYSGRSVHHSPWTPAGLLDQYIVRQERAPLSVCLRYSGGDGRAHRCSLLGDRRGEHKGECCVRAHRVGSRCQRTCE